MMMVMMISVYGRRNRIVNCAQFLWDNYEVCKKIPYIYIGKNLPFYLWRPQLWPHIKGSVSTAFAVWKYFSCIKKQLILCFDETKIDLKPLIMLF